MPDHEMPDECLGLVNECWIRDGSVQPMLYLRLALVNKQFHRVFMSDDVWSELDVYDVRVNVSRHYLDALKMMSANERHFIARFDLECWHYPLVSSPDEFNFFSSYTIGVALMESHLWLGTGRGVMDRRALYYAAVQPKVFSHAAKQVTDDVNFMRFVVSTVGPAQFRYCPQLLKDDLEFAREAVLKYPCNLQHVSATDRELVLAAVQRDGTCLEYAPTFQNDREVVMAAVQSRGCALKYASSALQRDKEISLAAIRQDVDAIDYTQLQDDREVGLLAVTLDGFTLDCLGELRADRDIVAVALCQNPDAFAFVDPQLQIEIIEAVIDRQTQQWRRAASTTNV